MVAATGGGDGRQSGGASGGGSAAACLARLCHSENIADSGVARSTHRIKPPRPASGVTVYVRADKRRDRLESCDANASFAARSVDMTRSSRRKSSWPLSKNTRSTPSSPTSVTRFGRVLDGNAATASATETTRTSSDPSETSSSGSHPGIHAADARFLRPASAGLKSRRCRCRRRCTPLATRAISDLTTRHPPATSGSAAKASTAASKPSRCLLANARACGVTKPPPARLSVSRTRRSSDATAGIITAARLAASVAEGSASFSSPRRAASRRTSAERRDTSACKSRNDARNSSSSRTATRANSETRRDTSRNARGEARRSAATTGSTAASDMDARRAFSAARSAASGDASSSALTSHAASASSAAAADSTATRYAMARGATRAVSRRIFVANSRTDAASDRSIANSRAATFAHGAGRNAGESRPARNADATVGEDAAAVAMDATRSIARARPTDLLALASPLAISRYRKYASAAPARAAANVSDILFGSPPSTSSSSSSSPYGYPPTSVFPFLFSSSAQSSYHDANSRHPRANVGASDTARVAHHSLAAATPSSGAPSHPSISNDARDGVASVSAVRAHARAATSGGNAWSLATHHIAASRSTGSR